MLFSRWLMTVALGMCCSAAVAGGANAPARAPGQKPNIVFILLDDQGWGDAGTFGHPYMKTPNIDRLVREGSYFTQFYVGNPVCSPSRTAFMTGHYPARHRIHGHLADHKVNARRKMPDWLDPDVTTVCDVLKSAGYVTGHFGKWHLGHGPSAPEPGQYGVDVHRTYRSSGPSWSGFDHFLTYYSKSPGWKREEKKYQYFWSKTTELIVDETMRFIKAHRDEPFYVNLWTLVPHAPLNPTPEEMAVYKDLKVDPNDFPSWMRDYMRSAKDPTAQMRVFCAAMTGLDRQIGRLLDFLDAEGLADNTIVVFSSDNGPEDYLCSGATNAGVGSAGVMRARKRSLYDGGIRTPLVVRWPGKVPAGRVDRTVVLASVDFLPTICRLAGVKLPDVQPDGEDTSDILLGASRERTRPLFWEWRFKVLHGRVYCPPSLAVRQGPWKLFCNPKGGEVRLYNIPADPEERTNVADQHPEVVDSLRKKLLEWKATLPADPE